MKFVLAAVVVLAVAMGVQSSLIAGVPGLGLGLGINGLGINGLGLNTLGLGLGVPGIGLGVRGLVAPGLLGVPGAINIAGNPWISASQIPAAVNIASGPIGGIALAQQASLASPLLGLGHGATYVAKTRGAVHTAPLPGHIQSAASINVAPAPGTW